MDEIKKPKSKFLFRVRKILDTYENKLKYKTTTYPIGESTYYDSFF